MKQEALRAPIWPSEIAAKGLGDGCRIQTSRLSLLHKNCFQRSFAELSLSGKRRSARPDCRRLARQESKWAIKKHRLLKADISRRRKPSKSSVAWKPFVCAPPCTLARPAKGDLTTRCGKLATTPATKQCTDWPTNLTS